MRKLEVIVLNSQDSIAAEAAGADRLELVSEMAVGGLSPAVEVVREVVNSVTIPVNVMIRFKYEDFIYDQIEMTKLIAYLEQIKDLGINGVVFGSLDTAGNIVFDQLQQVIDSCGHLDITYHRAIDQVQDKYLDNIDLIDGHVTNVLTSGGLNHPIEQNVELLAAVSDRRLNILVGGGINENNYHELFNSLKYVDFHVGTLAYNNGDFTAGINQQMISKLKAEMNK